MRHVLALGAISVLGACAMAQQQGTVKITPVGSHDGEFCAFDRALIFEDRDGTRVLYDIGRTVRGANDPRLGRIDAILLSHVHGDHVGDAHQGSPNAGSCGARHVGAGHAELQHRHGDVAARMPVHVPLSGKTMEFDGAGRCTAGC